MRPNACQYVSQFRRSMAERRAHLGDSILRSTDGQNSLNGSFGVVADGALGAGHSSDLRHVLTTFANDGGGLGTRDNRPEMDPLSFILRRHRCCRWRLSKLVGR